MCTEEHEAKGYKGLQLRDDYWFISMLKQSGGSLKEGPTNLLTTYRHLNSLEGGLSRFRWRDTKEHLCSGDTIMGARETIGFSFRKNPQNRKLIR